MPVNHSLKTTGNFYTRKYFSIEKNRNQRFFLLIVRSFIVFSPGFFNLGEGGAENFSFKNSQRHFCYPCTNWTYQKRGNVGLGLVLIILQRENCSKLMYVSRGGLDHYTTCKLTIDVWCGQQCHSRRHLIIIIIIISISI